MDCSCTPLLFLRPWTDTTFIVLAYLITGQLFTLTYGGPVSKTDNFTRLQADYTDFSHDLSLSHTFSNSKVLCYNKTDGMYRHSQSLNSYYMCNKGEYQFRQCSQGLVFNELSLKCEKRVTDTFESNPCDTQQDSFIPDYSSNCQQYYRCKSGLITERKGCNDGMQFSYTDQNCLPSDQVNCIQTHCLGSADGYYITPGSMCKAYYTCINGVKKDYICPTGLVFDRSSQTCTGSGGVCYELICTGRINGKYADTTHGCTRFYSCEGGTVKSVAGCSPGFLFNGSHCVDKSFVYCSSAENTAISLSLPTTDICTGLPDGANSVSDEYCQAYVLCKSGMTIAELQCPIGQNFDGHKCINSDLSPCSSFCADKSNGYHANIRKTCQEYVKCVDGHIINIQKCPDGTIFNGEICIECSSYNCPGFVLEKNSNRRQCLNLKDGFHTDYLTGCKDYFYCHKGEVLVQNSCSDNTVWNGRECVSRNDYTCEISRMSPECSIRGNGFFTDISKGSSCNKYYYCNNGVQVKLRCPFNQVFNGYNCVSPELYECPVIEIDCHDNTDGYYTDINSGCQSYYYCSNGNRITYLCPDDHVFNGNDCVLKHLYQCPGNLSDDCHNLHNGYYPDIQSGCQKYFYCLNYKKIMTFMCSSKEIFDGFKCVSAATNMCQTYTKISCSLLQNNVYIKPDSNCVEYFQCNNRKINAISRCNDGYVFNGTTCIKTAPELCNKLMTKQIEDLTNCNKKNNGFFPDLISRCTSYFYCIDGIKTSLTCPQGKLFNGAVCVSDINFQCPTNLVQLNT